jgi:DNA-binding PadR family transcriptional regulator
MQEIRLTLQAARVIRIFLEDPTKPRYGLELMQLAGLSSGTLYPMLARFEHAGWLAGGKENPENINPLAAGRPPRRVYTITDEALPAARAQLAALSEEFR